MAENARSSSRDKPAARSKTSTRRSKAHGADEPLRANVQGLPGAGKSRAIHWLRDLFENCFGWEHGREFYFVAPQNTMAALIGGQTLHTFGNLPHNPAVREERAMKQWAKPDLNPMYAKCLDLIWLILDEDSVIGCELLAALENTTTGAIRKRGTNKLRQDGSVRPFGGINVLFCGDWWQLPPVLQTSFPQTHSKSEQHQCKRCMPCSGRAMKTRSRSHCSN